MKERSKYSDIFQLIIGILSIIVGVLVLRNPTLGILGVALYLGIVTIAQGVSMIYVKIKNKDNEIGSDRLLLIAGLTNLIFGIFLLLSIKILSISVPLIFAIWILVESVIGILRSFTVSGDISGYSLLSLAACILGLIAGFMLLNSPEVATRAVTYIIVLYFFADGLKNIFKAIKN